MSIAGTAMYLLASVMMGLTTGISVVISRYYGAKEMKNVEEAYTDCCQRLITQVFPDYIDIHKIIDSLE